ncbi:MAG: ACP S-malonyltransferase [Spirochaetaceae bacterium]|nr:ACP S-malonyltransferase [Spirochaetaceae bacterium]
MKTCFLFPGQGAQYPGMGKDLFAASATVRELFGQASDATGLDLEALLFRGSAEDLQATNRTQIAVTLVNLAVARALAERGVEAHGYAGFSVGEYAALAAAGVIADGDLFRIVQARGEAMEAASRGADTDGGPAGMAAVIGLPPERVTAVLAGVDGAWAANFSSPAQVVLAGTAEGLAAAEQACTAAGARRFVALKVSGPFHSPLIESARVRFAEVVAGFTFHDPAHPVYANVTGGRIASGAEAKRLCVEQIVSSVQWVTEIHNLVEDGFERFLETGPGKVLTGLMRGFDTGVQCTPVGTMEQVEAAAAAE